VDVLSSALKNTVEKELPQYKELTDLSSLVSHAIQKIAKKETMVSLAVGSIDDINSLGWLDMDDIRAAMRTSAALDVQLQALLQSYMLNRGGTARVGKLNTNSLHRLAVADNRVFKRRIEKREVNTEIILLVDMTGSMQSDAKDDITSRALYGIFTSLRKIKGCISHGYGFSGLCLNNILLPSWKITPQMRIRPAGSTFLGSSLMHIFGKFTNADARKIVIILSDGDTGDSDILEKAIDHAKAYGVELVGIGIVDNHLLQYLPKEECCVVNDLNKLVPEMFRILRHKLLGSMAA
jgi:hypothetical protein